MTETNDFQNEEEIFDGELGELTEDDDPVSDVSDAAPMSCVENELEWLRGQKTVSGTLCRGRIANRIRRLAAEHPDEVEIIKENSDGSIFFHIPLSYLHIYAPHKRELTDEEREAAGERFRNMWQKRRSGNTGISSKG